MMDHWTGAAPAPPFLVGTNARADFAWNTHWSGYVVLGNQGEFTHAETSFIEPDKTYDSACSQHAEVTWAGIGGWSSGDNWLAQNGTYLGNALSGITSHQAWWEIVPAFGIHPAPFYATPNAEFDASTRYLGNGTYRFFYYNYYTGQSWAHDSESGYGYVGKTAEAIAERPYGSNGDLTYLSNFGTLDFLWSEANGSAFNNWSPDGGRTSVNMYAIDTGDHLAIPSDLIGGSDGGFNDTWRNCK